jgi:hypothetical protein
MRKINNVSILFFSIAILISSIMLSISRAEAHSGSASKKEFLALKKCIQDFRSEALEFHEFYLRTEGELRWGTPDKWNRYLSQGAPTGGNYFPKIETSVFEFIADNMKC